MLNAKELREKSQEELKELEASLQSDLINLRVALATGGEVNVSKFREIRRDVARIKTVQNAKSAQPASKEGAEA